MYFKAFSMVWILGIGVTSVIKENDATVLHATINKRNMVDKVCKMFMYGCLKGFDVLSYTRNKVKAGRYAKFLMIGLMINVLIMAITTLRKV